MVITIKVGIFNTFAKILKLKGKLYLIPSTLGGENPGEVIPQGTIDVINTLNFFVVEELRSARRYLSSVGLKGKIDSLQFGLLNEHSTGRDVEAFIDILNSGVNVGLISEAGLPAVADPGSNLVELAHRHQIEVVPLTGPSSLMLALMASGKNGQKFTFNGYLPVKTEERKHKIKELEKISRATGVSQIFIETPYRNDSLFGDLLQICSAETKLTVACNITMKDAFIITRTVSEWRENRTVIGKRPSVFIL
jgi:16S rRNA (cytidine1402-2'-O)-methyltransferase